MSRALRVSVTMIRAAEALHATSHAILTDPACEALIQALSTTTGKVVVTGMGKIGYMGARFAMTLASTGTPACFLHPGEALHGDLGLLSANDLLLALSNSGKTREVLETLTHAHTLYPSLTLATISGQPMSDTPEAIALIYGVVREACPLGLTPTTSLSVVGALLDGLALAVLDEKGFTQADYARRHHGGYLGQKARGD